MEGAWPYSTLDEVSHLACDDVPMLRARIDMLLEERSEQRGRDRRGEVMLPLALGLSPQEDRVLATLMSSPKDFATKDVLHAASSLGVEADSNPKIVDVIVCKLRKKLTPHGLRVETVWGKGYRLADDFRGLLALL